MTCQAGDCDCDKRPWVPDNVHILPMPDLLCGEKVWKTLVETFGTVDNSDRMMRRGISIDVCDYLPPDMIIGCTERGREFVRAMKEGQA